MELDSKELKKLKELVPYRTLAPTPNEIIKEIERLQKIIKKAAEVLGEYTTYSSPTKEQLRKNDSIVDKTYDILAPEEIEEVYEE